MADGQTPALIADGVFLDLPLWQYLADPALSGSAFKTLLVDPPDWKWQRPDNPLRERTESRPQVRGSAAHAAILEGLAAYEARYALEPRRSDHPEALDTASDMKAWLKGRDLKVSGDKAELRERILGACHPDDAPDFWEDLEERLLNGRTPIKSADDAYVRMLERFVRSDEAFAPLVTGGLAEVSIFWTEDGQRNKARLDYLNALGVLDLKTFGQPPMQGRTLLQHVLREASIYGYDIQAVHNARALKAARERITHADFAVHASASGDGFGRIDQAIDLITEAADAFTWLFIRMGSYPTGVAVKFGPRDRYGNPDAIWEAAERKVEVATANFNAYAKTCGDGPWMRSDGLVACDAADWPLFVSEIAGDH
jgi:hypothetical protein